MMQRGYRFLLVMASGLLVAGGCGTSGSSPTLQSEVRFQVQSNTGGVATFSVPSLVGNGNSFTFGSGATFATSGVFSFYLEGAAPPYSGTFVQEGDTPITVRIFINDSSLGPGTVTSGNGTMVTVTAEGTPGTPTVPAPQVRFDVCAPLGGSGACSTTGDSGIPGIPYSGSIGDQFMSHLLPSDNTRLTPAVYFLANPRDSANGIFSPISGQFLEVQLWIDNSLEQSESGTKSDDLILRKDL